MFRESLNEGGGVKHIEFQNNMQKIKRYRGVIQSENITKHGTKNNDKDEIRNILLKHVLTRL